MAFQILLLLLVPYALPLLMPSWRWLLAYAVAAAVLLTIWFYGVMTTPTRTGLEVIGLAFAASAAISTAAGTMVRTVTLFVRARSVVVAISVLGAILLIVAVLVWAIW